MIRGTRLAVSFLLACLADGMTPEQIRSAYGDFPEQAISEILHIAADGTGAVRA